MTPATYESALLALQSYRAAKSDDILEILCVACTLRNRVLRYGQTYTQVLEAAEISRPWPDIRNPIMINPSTGILAQVDAIYKHETPDLTANHLKKNGALYFCRVVEHQDSGDWYDINILDNPNEHALIGTWGSLQFFE